MKRPVAVVGAGSWGTALARVLGTNGHTVRLWAREAEVVDAINHRHENPDFLPGVILPEAISATSDLAAALYGVQAAVSVVPSQFARSVWKEAANSFPDDALLISASKGIEVSTLLRMDEVLEDVLGQAIRSRFCVLSGPSFAAEVAAEQPTLVVAAAHQTGVAEAAQELFQNPYFRVYTHSDVIGVELGALKNVMAIAAGVAAGLGYGHNTRAALITRGLAEMARLGVAMGGRRDTFSGLAGMGDLVLTCTGDLSRNRTVGRRLGEGETLEEILGGRTVAEGVRTVQAVRELSIRHGVEMPIVEEVHAMLADGRAPAEALKRLMTREPKSEELE